MSTKRMIGRMAGLCCLLLQAVGPERAAAQAEHSFQATVEEAERSLSAALLEKGAGDRPAAAITGQTNRVLYAAGRPLEIAVKSLEFDKASGRFTANLLFASGEEVLSAMPVTGRFHEMVELPVLKRQVHAGEMIERQDIELRDYPLARTRKDTIESAEALIGKSPRRMISAYRPVRSGEIESPAVLKRHDLVQMRYRIKNLEITTSGQAMGPGAQGEVISVKNMASKAVVQAVVEGPGVVRVAAPGATSESAQLSEVPHAPSN